MLQIVKREYLDWNSGDYSRLTRLSSLYFRVVRHRGGYQNASPAVPARATACNSRITQNSRLADT
jgi:hypothetical protein